MQESAPESPFSTTTESIAVLSGRPFLISSSDLALSCGSSVQRSFCGDVIAIMSWAPDVVNLVRPKVKRGNSGHSLTSTSLLEHSAKSTQ